LYQQALEENITYSNPTIQTAAVAAMRQFCHRYYLPTGSIPHLASKYHLQGVFSLSCNLMKKSRYAQAINTDLNADVRRGYCMAIGR
jgi:hypothetical protein